MDHYWSDDHWAVRADAQAFGVGGAAPLRREGMPTTPASVPCPLTTMAAEAERS